MREVRKGAQLLLLSLQSGVQEVLPLPLLAIPDTPRLALLPRLLHDIPSGAHWRTQAGAKIMQTEYPNGTCYIGVMSNRALISVIQRVHSVVLE